MAARLCDQIPRLRSVSFVSQLSRDISKQNNIPVIRKASKPRVKFDISNATYQKHWYVLFSFHSYAEITNIKRKNYNRIQGSYPFSPSSIAVLPLSLVTFKLRATASHCRQMKTKKCCQLKRVTLPIKNIWINWGKTFLLIIYGRMILNKSMETIIVAKKFPSQLIIFVPRTPFLQLTQQRCPR